MTYKIHTAPIWDAFKLTDVCPICELRRATEERLLGQYLNESVMEPDARVRVNRQGFCGSHSQKMLAGGNICGFALQLQTRNRHIRESLKLIEGAKRAQKEASRLQDEATSCIICAETEQIMARYYQTIALMFKNEKTFPELARDAACLCVNDYSRLLAHSAHAGSRADDYRKTLYLVITRSLSQSDADLAAFIDRFDYQKKDASVMTPEQKAAPVSAVRKLTRL
ncbi:MAG: DUF6062 family protein [Clostridiales bacterium]|jgi:hypothetical protein|nr:DUF6062 family protein [Clostridiales bacterium]